MSEKKKVLVVGGSGYLGQHLLQALSESSYDLAFTYRSDLPGSLRNALPPPVHAFQVDLQTGSGFHSISQAFGQPDVVVNCAAISVPRVCESDPEKAMSVNVPSTLLSWLSLFEKSNALLVHLSTDQGSGALYICMDQSSISIKRLNMPIKIRVYEGTKSFYKEEDETVPVNVYGKSKVAAEQYISKNSSNYAILRSSIIFGPQSISPVPKSLPIQWIDGVLSRGDKVEFFNDEFRCPVYVKDVVAVIQALADKWILGGKQMQLLLNVGGPDRVSRAHMAEVVAEVRDHNPSLIKPVSASTIDRGVQSPADISMDITKLVQTLQISPTSFREGVKLTLEASS